MHSEYNLAKTAGMSASPRGASLKAGGRAIRMGNTLKYLGVTLDSQVSFGPHVRGLRDLVYRVVGKLVRLGDERVGIKGKMFVRIIYKSVIEPSLIYGAEVWGKKAGRVRMRRALDAAHRSALLCMAGAYRTASTCALQVLLGVRPL